jgi:hypothetical protein
MSTPVLIDPATGNVVLNVKSGPAPGTYSGPSLDTFPYGALAQFKKKLVSVTGEDARKTSGNALRKAALTYIAEKDKQAMLEGELVTAKLRKNTRRINTLTKEIAEVRKRKQFAIGTQFNQGLKQKKIACGWTPGWIPGSLVAPKNPRKGCEPNNLIGGTRKRKVARRSYTLKH